LYLTPHILPAPYRLTFLSLAMHMVLRRILAGLALHGGVLGMCISFAGTWGMYFARAQSLILRMRVNVKVVHAEPRIQLLECTPQKRVALQITLTGTQSGTQS